MKDALPRDLFRLYQLIWKRFVASRMEPAVYETVSADIRAGEYSFRAAASRIKYDGFMSVYTEEEEEKKDNCVQLRSLNQDTELKLLKYDKEQHFNPAAGPLYRSISGQDSGGAGHWPAQYVCADDQHNHKPQICGQGKQESVHDRTGGSCKQYDEAGISQYCGR